MLFWILYAVGVVLLLYLLKRRSRQNVGQSSREKLKAAIYNPKIFRRR